MGVATSNIKTSTITNVTDEAIAKCPHVSASGTMDLARIKFTAPADCPDGSNFTINQNATVNGECVLSNLQSLVSTHLLEAGAQAQTGLGLAVANTQQDVQTNLVNKINQECGNITASTDGKLYDLNLNVCNFAYVQNVDAVSKCKLNAIQNMANTLSQKAGSESTGATIPSITGLTGASTVLIGLGVAIVGLVCIFLLILLFKTLLGGQSSGTGQSGGARQSCETISVLLSLLIIYYVTTILLTPSDPLDQSVLICQQYDNRYRREFQE